MMIKNKKLCVLILFTLICVSCSSKHSVSVEMKQEQPFKKYWIWLDDKTGMEKKLFNQETIQFKIRVDKNHPNAMISWQMQSETFHSGNTHTHNGFSVLLNDTGLCKKVVNLDEIGRIEREISFYKNKYGMCSNEGKIKNY